MRAFESTMRGCWVLAAALSACVLTSTAAYAQDDEGEAKEKAPAEADKGAGDDAEEEGDEEADEPEEAPAKAAAAAPAVTPEKVTLPEGPEPGKKPLLSWGGGLEWDIGYARYDAEEPSITDDRFFDHRGRVVVGPLLHVDIGESLFFEATGQLVGWIKERGGSSYQINVDDAWGKFGQEGLWDIQVGRFEAWPVYNKSPVRDRDDRPDVELNESTGAFDLYTLEDTGALCNPPIALQGYCVDMYEVNFILLREEVGSVAFHLFPHKMIKFELHGKYGDQAGQANHIGGRGAVIFTPIKYLQFSAGAEYRTLRQSSPAKIDPESDGIWVDRVDGARLDRRGAGGGLVIKVGPVELAGNAAIGIVDSWDPESQPIADNSPQILSFGGYAQVEAGPITIGGAGNYTERTDPSNNLQTHIQTAGYVYYPFWDKLSLKLVGTYAMGTDDPFILRGTREPPTNTFFGARLRLKYVFTTL